MQDKKKTSTSTMQQEKGAQVKRRSMWSWWKMRTCTNSCEHYCFGCSEPIGQISNLCAANIGSWSAFFLPPIWNVFTDFACSKVIILMLNKEKYWKRFKNTQKNKRIQKKKKKTWITTRCFAFEYSIFLNNFVHSFKNLISIKPLHCVQITPVEYLSQVENYWNVCLEIKWCSL